MKFDSLLKLCKIKTSSIPIGVDIILIHKNVSTLTLTQDLD